MRSSVTDKRAFTPIEGCASFSWRQLERNLDVDVGLQTTFVVLQISTAPWVDDTVAVALVIAQLNRIALGQVQLKSVVCPRAEPVRHNRTRQLYKNISMLFLFPVKYGKLSTGVNAQRFLSCYG